MKLNSFEERKRKQKYIGLFSFVCFDKSLKTLDKHVRDNIQKNFNSVVIRLKRTIIYHFHRTCYQNMKGIVWKNNHF